MNSILIFLFGFISAFVMMGVIFLILGLWWFLSYSRHMEKKKEEQKKSALQQALAKKMKVETELM